MLVVIVSQPAGAQTEGTPRAGTQPGPAGGDSPYVPENPYGVNLFLHKEVESWKIEETLRLAAAANIPWVKQEFPWQEIEFKKGYFYDDKWQKSSWEKFDFIVDLAEYYGIEVVARVSFPPEWAKAAPGGDSPLKDYKDLADFTNALLDHYKGRIKYVQMWNEPNLAAEWIPGKPADPSGYAAMLKEVYPAVKAAHPDAAIISAPLAMTLEGPELRGNMNELDYWEGLYEAGVKGNFDIASANGYGLDQPPDAEPGREVLNFRRVELLRRIMVDNGDEGTPIWFNEYGWNASPDTLTEEQRNYWRHVTPEQQAEWTVEGIEYARENWPWVGVTFIWYLRQVGDITPDLAEYYFGMVDPEFKVQPVYEAVKSAATKLPGPAGRLPERRNPLPTPQGGAPAEPSPTAAPQTPAPQVTDTPQAAPTQPPTDATAVATPGATPTSITPAVAGSNNSVIIMYIVGGLLVVSGLAGLGYYFMKRG